MIAGSLDSILHYLRIDLLQWAQLALSFAGIVWDMCPEVGFVFDMHPAQDCRKPLLGITAVFLESALVRFDNDQRRWDAKCRTLFGTKPSAHPC
jgi:hypothetical protein